MIEGTETGNSVNQVGYDVYTNATTCVERYIVCKDYQNS